MRKNFSTSLPRSGGKCYDSAIMTNTATPSGQILVVARSLLTRIVLLLPKYLIMAATYFGSQLLASGWITPKAESWLAAGAALLAHEIVEHFGVSVGKVAAVGLLAFGLLHLANGCSSPAVNPPTTQQSLADDQTVYNLEAPIVDLAIGAGNVYIANHNPSPVVTAAIQAAQKQAQADLAQFQADISSGNAAAATADRQALGSAIVGVAEAAGEAAYVTELQTLLQTLPA